MSDLEITNLTLAYQLLELKPLLEGAFVNKVQEIDKETFKLKLHTPKGTKDLILNPHILYVTEYKVPAKQNAHGFAAFLKKHLSNKKIVSVRQHEMDRVVTMEFHDYLLILEFFSNSNIILAGKDLKILNPLKGETWKDRTLKKGFDYRFPASKGLNPATLSLPKVESLFSESKLDIIHTMIKGINIAPVFAEEVCHSLSITPGTAAKKITKQQAKKIHGKLEDLYKKTSLKKLKPVLMKMKKEVMLPFPLASLKQQPAAEFPSLNSALDGHYSKSLLQKERRQAVKEKQTELGRAEFSFKQQLEAEKTLKEKAESSEKKAELIYKHFQDLEQLLTAIKAAEKKGAREKEIMNRISDTAKAGDKQAKLLDSIDLKRKKIVVVLD